MTVHLDCLCSTSITFLLMSTINNALVYIDEYYFHPFQHRLVLFSWAFCNSYLQISENLKRSSDRASFLPLEESLFFHLIILDRVGCFTGDKSEIILWMTLTFFSGLFGGADAALLTKRFNVTLLLNPGEDSDIGVDVCKGSCAGMRVVTLQFYFLVRSFCKCFLYASLFCFNRFCVSR